MPFFVSVPSRAAILIAFALLLGTPVSQAAAATTAPAETQFTLQVGAFADAETADQVAAGIEGAWVQVIVQDTETIFRVNCGRFQTRSQAVQAQWNLDDAGFDSAIQQVFA